MTIIRGCFTVLGVIAFLVFLTLVAGYFLLALNPPLWSQRVPVALSAEAVESLNQKLETLESEIEAAVEEGQEREVSFVVTEEEINSKLIEVLAEDKMPFKEILFNFREDGVFGFAILDIPGLKPRVAVRAMPEIDEGRLKIVVEDLDLGKLPLPKSMNQWGGYTMQILTELVTIPGDLPWKITQIQISGGEVAVAGVTKKL